MIKIVYRFSDPLRRLPMAPAQHRVPRLRLRMGERRKAQQLRINWNGRQPVQESLSKWLNRLYVLDPEDLSDFGVTVSDVNALYMANGLNVTASDRIDEIC